MGYAFHLARWRGERDMSLRCPDCNGLKCFKEYVDDNGDPVDSENHSCGKCDHEWCGYHLPPSEYFKKNPGEHRTVEVKEKKQMKRIEIGRDVMERSLRKYDENNLVKWLKTLPFNDDTKKCIDVMCAMYLVGTSKDGGTIFWQMDEHGIVRTGKKITYKSDGHRKKGKDGNAVGMNWIHTMMDKRTGEFPREEYQLVQCLFGQHLIVGHEDDDIVVNIVESEKTALIMALLDDSFGEKNLWMACGGLYCLNESTLLPLKGHHVMLYPDANGVTRWTDEVKKNKLKNVEICTGWMKFMTEDDPEGADIADVCVRRLYMTDKAKLMAMAEKNPCVNGLVDRLHLELRTR